MVNCLVRIKYGPFKNTICIVKDEDGIGYFVTNYKIAMWLDKEEVDFLSNEPQFNQFNRIRCYWCDSVLKFFREKKMTNDDMCYCPKCLR